MATYQGFHWRAPTLILGSLLSGLALILGHHFFYHNLNGTQPRSYSYHVPGLKYSLTDQRINLVGGTALAFMVKTCLGIAMSSAYTQILWKVFRMHSLQISSANAIFCLMSNPLGLLSYRLWWMHPFMMLLALGKWIIPFATIIPPATLTVAMAPYINLQQLHVPMTDFASLNFANTKGVTILIPAATDEEDPIYAYNGTYLGPQSAVARVVSASVLQGSVLSITPPLDALNASWALDFPGPAIQCRNVSTAMRNAIIGTISNKRKPCPAFYGFMSWVPENSDLMLNTSMPNNQTLNTSLGPVNVTGPTPATIFVAAFPDWVPANALQPYDCQTFDGSTILQCQLYNASYHAEFSYTNGVQDVNITLGQRYNDVHVLSEIRSSNATAESSLAVTTVRNLAYQSVMDSFGVTLVGEISTRFALFDSSYVSVSSAVLSTVLAETIELQFLKPITSTSLLSEQPFTGFSGLSVTNTTPSTMPLASALEDSFQNVTVSLMSSELLRANLSSPYAPPPITANFTNYQATYEYAVSTLWISYGIALCISTFGVLLGLLTIIQTKSSFTDDFSTILRATRKAELSTAIDDQDTDGRDPLPKYIGDARINLAKSAIHQDADVDGADIRLTVQAPKSTVYDAGAISLGRSHTYMHVPDDDGDIGNWGATSPHTRPI